VSRPSRSPKGSAGSRRRSSACAPRARPEPRFSRKLGDRVLDRSFTSRLTWRRRFVSRVRETIGGEG
jgi:hypothetical protein